MHAQAYHDEDQTGGLDPNDFLEVIGELREEVESMGGEVSDVLKENEELKREVARLKTRRKGGRSRSQMERIKRECLDGLDRLNELASVTRIGPRRLQQKVPQQAPEPRRASSDSAWMKKMMMVMMMADMA